MRTSLSFVAASLLLVSVASAETIHSVDPSKPPSGAELAKVEPLDLARRHRDAAELRTLVGTTLRPGQPRLSAKGSNQFARTTQVLSVGAHGKITSASRNVVRSDGESSERRTTQVSSYGTRFTDRTAFSGNGVTVTTYEPKRGAQRTELHVSRPGEMLRRETSSRDTANARPRFDTPSSRESDWAPSAVATARELGRTISIRTSYGLVPVGVRDDAASVERRVADRRAKN